MNNKANNLSETDIATFWQNGYVTVENAVTDDELKRLQGEFNNWVAESQGHTEPWGTPTVDNRPRFDIGAEHTATDPALRRVNNPSEISDTYLDVMRGAAVVDMVADLIGPNIKYHHCKINSKLPGNNTVVHWHQDFPYTPHTNDDVVTALLMLDDVTEENGCLLVAPGTHRGPVNSLFQDGVFTGTVDAETTAALAAQEVPVMGKAGSVCLMHTRLQHSSRANKSDHSRTLYICVYSAADAVPIARNPMPSRHEGLIVNGVASPVARMIPLEVELPAQPKSASFFTVQGQQSATSD
jgi:ectoine hydroxylase-related dioxygenase (phytanoyl-CoA dioxygenase family)